jgi:hypothetical protein
LLQTIEHKYGSATPTLSRLEADPVEPLVTATMNAAASMPLLRIWTATQSNSSSARTALVTKSLLMRMKNTAVS